MDQMEQTIFGPWRFGDPAPRTTANDERPASSDDQAQAGAGMESMGPKWQRRIRWVARQLRAWDEAPLAEQLEWIVEDVQDWGMQMCDRYEREIELMRQAMAGQGAPQHPAVASEDSKLQAFATVILEQKLREARQWLREIYEAATGTAYSDNLCWTEAIPSLVEKVRMLADQANDERRATTDQAAASPSDGQLVVDPRSDGQLGFDLGQVPRLKTITTEQYVQAVAMRSEGDHLPVIARELDLPLKYFSTIGPMIAEHARQRGLLRSEHDRARWDKVLARQIDSRRREQ